MGACSRAQPAKVIASATLGNISGFPVLRGGMPRHTRFHKRGLIYHEHENASLCHLLASFRSSSKRFMIMHGGAWRGHSTPCPCDVIVATSCDGWRRFVAQSHGPECRQPEETGRGSRKGPRGTMVRSGHGRPCDMRQLQDGVWNENLTVLVSRLPPDQQ